MVCHEAGWLVADRGSAGDGRFSSWGYRERDSGYVHITVQAVARQVCDNNPERYELVRAEDWRAAN